MRNNKIYRAGAIIIKDRKILVERSRNKTFFIPPGGVIENDETPKTGLIRELFEELKIKVNESNLQEFKVYFKPAGGQESQDLEMHMFIGNGWSGKIISDNEVEEIKWVNSQNSEKLVLGSIFEHEVLPKLKEQNLID